MGARALWRLPELDACAADVGLPRSRKSRLGFHIDNRCGFLGARFWGQVRGSSRRLRVFQGRMNERGNQPDCRESALPSVFPRPHTIGRSLHGKEGVDGSSPSEGFARRPANARICCQSRRVFVTSGHITDTHLAAGPSRTARFSQLALSATRLPATALLLARARPRRSNRVPTRPSREPRGSRPLLAVFPFRRALRSRERRSRASSPGSGPPAGRFRPR